MGDWGCIIFIVVICGGWDTMIETIGPRLTAAVYWFDLFRKCNCYELHHSSQTV